MGEQRPTSPPPSSEPRPQQGAVTSGTTQPGGTTQTLGSVTVDTKMSSSESLRQPPEAAGINIKSYLIPGGSDESLVKTTASSKTAFFAEEPKSRSAAAILPTDRRYQKILAKVPEKSHSPPRQFQQKKATSGGRITSVRSTTPPKSGAMTRVKSPVKNIPSTRVSPPKSTVTLSTSRPISAKSGDVKTVSKVVATSTRTSPSRTVSVSKGSQAKQASMVTKTNTSKSVYGETASPKLSKPKLASQLVSQSSTSAASSPTAKSAPLSATNKSSITDKHVAPTQLTTASAPAMATTSLQSPKRVVPVSISSLNQNTRSSVTSPYSVTPSCGSKTAVSPVGTAQITTDKSSVSLFTPRAKSTSVSSPHRTFSPPLSTVTTLVVSTVPTTTISTNTAATIRPQRPTAHVGMSASTASQSTANMTSFTDRITPTHVVTSVSDPAHVICTSKESSQPSQLQTHSLSLTQPPISAPVCVSHAPGSVKNSCAIESSQSSGQRMTTLPKSTFSTHHPISTAVSDQMKVSSLSSKSDAGTKETVPKVSGTRLISEADRGRGARVEPLQIRSPIEISTTSIKSPVTSPTTTSPPVDTLHQALEVLKSSTKEVTMRTKKASPSGNGETAQRPRSCYNRDVSGHYQKPCGLPREEEVESLIVPHITALAAKKPASLVSSTGQQAREPSTSSHSHLRGAAKTGSPLTTESDEDFFDAEESLESKGARLSGREKASDTSDGSRRSSYDSQLSEQRRTSLENRLSSMPASRVSDFISCSYPLNMLKR